jgi:hypothetical protein
MSKIKLKYCKNCIHESGSNYSVCYEEYNPLNDALISSHYQDRNFNGDCDHYKRKWWKFWVKD